MLFHSIVVENSTLVCAGDVGGRRCGVVELVVGEEDEESPCVACYGSQKKKVE